MIPTIGLMIGGYIFTRAAQIASRTGERQESGLARFLAMLLMLFTALCMYVLVQSGITAENQLKGVPSAFP